MFIVVAVATTSSRARAAPKAVKLRIEGTCTGDDDFWRRIERRTWRVERALHDDGADVVEIAIGSANGVVDGSFRILTNGDASEVRHMRGASCEEVVDGLSLMIALAYDANAKIDPADAPVPSTQTPTAMPPPQRQAEPSTDSRRDRPDRPGLGPLWKAGAHVSMALSNANPKGGEVFIDVASPRGPSARLALSVAYTTVDVTPSTAQFLWASVIPQGCPMTLQRGRASVSPCAGISLGALHASSGGSEHSTRFTRAWVAPRVAVRLEVALFTGVGIEGEAGVEFPLVRNRYGFEERRAYDVPIALPVVLLGLTVSLDRR